MAAAQRIIDTCCKILHSDSGQPLKLSTLLIVGLGVDSGQSAGENLQILIIHIAVRDALKQFLEGNRAWLGVCGRSRYFHLMLRNPNGIDQIEKVFAMGVGRYDAKLLVSDGAHTASFHLGIERFGFDVTHKHHHFNRLDIRSGGHQRHGDGDTEFLVIAEMTDEFVAVPSRVGYLLDKLIVALRPAEYLLCNLDDIAGVIVIEGEN